MTRGQGLAAIARGIELDTAAYRELRTLLDEQFRAALRHDAPALAALVSRITSLVEAMDQRRVERGTACEALAGPGARMPAILALLPAAQRATFAGVWSVLETLVADCKRLNLRNGHLMTDQHELMTRLLRGDVDTYAPA